MLTCCVDTGVNVNRKELRDKIEWEGGLTDALEYGLTANDIDEDDFVLRAAWEEMQGHYDLYSYNAEIVEDMLELLE